MRYQRRNNLSMIFLLLYLIFGLYFINAGIGYIKIPESISVINPWMSLVGGVLILIGGFNHWRVNRYRVIQ